MLTEEQKNNIDSLIQNIKLTLLAMEGEYKMADKDRFEALKEEIIKEVIKEVPVTVEVEKRYIPEWCWYSLIGNIVVVLLIGFRLYLKFKP